MLTQIEIEHDAESIYGTVLSSTEPRNQHRHDIQLGTVGM